MSNEVFGVNAANVAEKVRYLIGVYKEGGEDATLKEWGFNLNLTPYATATSGEKPGKEDFVICKFLRVLFEEKNDVFILKVLNIENPHAVFEINPTHLKQNISLFDVLHSKASPTITLAMRMLVNAWAVYNLPILQRVLDLVVNHIYENLESFIDFDGLKEYLEDIEWEYEENKAPNSKPFEEYLRSCIEEDVVVEWVKRVDFLREVYDEVKDEVEWEYLLFVWCRFCASHEFLSALHFVKAPLKNIVSKVASYALAVN